jgi:hypothetical protein
VGGRREGCDPALTSWAHLSVGAPQHLGPPQRTSMVKPPCKTALGGALNGFAKMKGLKIQFYS